MKKRIALVGGSSTLSNYIKNNKFFTSSYEIITIGRNDDHIYCDLSKDESFTIPCDIDIVIHTAACFDIETDKNILNTEIVNSLGTLKVCIAARKSRAKQIIIISTISSIIENTSVYYNIYGISKRHAEDLATYYCNKYNINLTILRPSQIYDEKSLFKRHQPLFFNIIEKAYSGENIVLYGSNDAMRNYIHISDIVKIILYVVEKGVVGVYNCTYQTDVRLSYIAKIALEVFGKGGEIYFDDSKDNVFDNIFPIDNDLYNKINYYPVIDIKEGVKMIYTYRERIKAHENDFSIGG